MHLRTRRAALALACCLVATGADARSTLHDLSVADARETGHGREKLLDVPFYMAGQKHRRVAKDLGTFTANRRTNAFNKTDEEACKIAFLSAIISLQDRARKMGADAVVEIKSTTKNDTLASTSQYRCAAGNVVANVVLTGRVVRFGQ